MIRLDRARALAERGARRTSSNIRIPCPVHGSSGDALSLTADERGRAAWYCYAGCDSDAVRDALIERGILYRDGPESAARKTDSDETRKLEWAGKRWREASILGRAAQAYFERRRIPWSIAYMGQAHSLRWGMNKTLLGRVTDNAGNGIALHRTWTETGERRLHCSPKGGAIRLFGNQCVSGRVTIAEGIETALAYRALHPGCGLVWSLISAGGDRAL